MTTLDSANAPQRWPARPCDPELWHVLWQFTQAITDIRPAMAHKMHMGVTDLVMMEKLSMGPQCPSALAIRRLELGGHVMRTPDASDGRRVAVGLSASGRATVHTTLDPMLTELAEVCGELDTSEAEVVSRFLSKMAATLAKFAAADDADEHEVENVAAAL